MQRKRILGWSGSALRGLVIAGAVAFALPAWASGDSKSTTAAPAAAPAAPAGPTAAQVAEQQKRIAADKAFVAAHPEAGEVRAEVLDQLRLLPILQVGELPIGAAEPHHLPLDVAGDGYRLTLPDLSVDLGGDRLVLGTVTAEFAATGPHRMDVELAVPEKLVVLDASGQAAFEVAIGSQRIAGTWDRRVGNFIALDGELAALTGGVPGQPMVEIGAIRAVTTSEDLSDDVMNLEATMEIEAINAVGFFTLARIKLAGDVENLDIPAYVAFRKLAEDHEFLAKLERLERMDLPEVQAMLGPRLQPLRRVYDAAGASYRFEGLKIADENFFAGPAAGGAIEAIEVAISLDGVESDEAKGTLSFAIDQLQVPPGQLPPPVEKLLPNRAGFTLALERLPLGELWDVGIDFLTKGPSQEDPAAAIGGLRAVYPLMRNQSALALSDFAIEGPAAGLTADGEARIDPASPLLTTGDGAIVIRNFDEIVAVAKQMGAPPDFDAMVALVTAFGERMEETGGYRFRLEVTAEGKITVNDKPVDPLLQAIGMR